MELVLQLILGAIALFGGGAFLKHVVDRGTSSSVEGKATELAARKSELAERKDEMSDLEYNQQKESLEADERRLKNQAKDDPEVEVDNEEIDEMSATDLARELNRHTG